VVFDLTTETCNIVLAKELAKTVQKSVTSTRPHRRVSERVFGLGEENPAKVRLPLPDKQENDTQAVLEQAEQLCTDLIA
jgi:hypothetical protein